MYSTVYSVLHKCSKCNGISYNSRVKLFSHHGLPSDVSGTAQLGPRSGRGRGHTGRAHQVCWGGTTRGTRAVVATNIKRQECTNIQLQSSIMINPHTASKTEYSCTDYTVMREKLD